jgi:hypothetical protein
MRGTLEAHRVRFFLEAVVFAKLLHSGERRILYFVMPA